MLERQATAAAPPPSLAQRNFPRRVRMLLEGVLKLVSDDLERGLSVALNEMEQHLFKLAEQARSNEVQQHFFEVLREVKRGRGDLVPRYLVGLEASLATLRDQPVQGMAGEAPKAGELSLVTDIDIDESVILNEIAARAEIRNSLPLFLLGQRFGVIAGRPAFDSETLPVGPHALCHILREASGCLGMDKPDRVLFYRQFERAVLSHAHVLLETLNNYLIEQQVLPTLTFVPVRARKMAMDTDIQAGPGQDSGQHRRRKHDKPPGATKDAVVSTGVDAADSVRKGGPEATASDESEQQMFETLRQLLGGRRNLLGKLGASQPGEGAYTATRSDVQTVLGMLQARPSIAIVDNGKARPRSIRQVKQDLLGQLRRIAPGDAAPQLDDEDSDTIDLVGLLFENLMQDVRPHSPAAELLTRMQVPLLRVALQDKSFFTRREHPARLMLANIAETGARWVGEDEVDRGLIEKMRLLVDRVNSEFDGDPNMLGNMVSDLGSHLQLIQRKADVAEKRHIEAARGKEKLELSRLHAAEAIDRLLKGKHVPRFLHTLLAQAWTDVLALTLLRHGGDSDNFRLQQHVARRLIESAANRHAGGDALIGPTEAASLRDDIEQALGQVGYHREDALAIATRLLALSQDEGEEQDDPASRTELAMRLKNRARLGEGVTGDDGHGAAEKDLDAGEKAQLEIIRKLPFGTWMEFTINQQGDRVRRRLSWYSTVTGHSLFVNHRGQRVGEYSLRWLARELNRGNVHIVQADQGNMIDRAWSRIVNALRSFAGAARPASNDQRATP